jgi:hypothetical protein
MHPLKDRAVRNALRDWVDIEAWQAPFAVTLTLRQSINVEENSAIRRLWLTDQQASQNFRHFMNMLNRRTFGKTAIRYGRGVSVLPVLEGGDGKRLHYHAAIDCPRSSLAQDFPSIIGSLWRSTMWGYDQIEVRPDADRGWLNYITKLRDKPDFASAIDWVNVRLP